MSFGPTNSIASYLPSSIDFEQNPQPLSEQLNYVYSLIANATNAREIGFYLNTENLSGGQLFTTGNPQKNRYIYRRSYGVTITPFGTSATTTIPHGIDFGNTNLQFVAIYGAATLTTTGAIPLPFIGANSVYLSLTTTNIVITQTAATYDNYAAIVTLEYVKG